MILVTENCYLAIVASAALLTILFITVLFLERRLFWKRKQLRRAQNLLALELLRLRSGLSAAVIDATVSAVRRALQRSEVLLANDLLVKFAYRLRKVIPKD